MTWADRYWIGFVVFLAMSMKEGSASLWIFSMICLVCVAVFHRDRQ